MKRRNFFLSAGVLLLTLPSLLFSKTELLRSSKRTTVKKRWMDMKQSFNYFDYDSANEMGFGVLRVIDDFKLTHLSGTPKHAHKNIEILSILLEGQVFHQDSLGNSGLLKAGDMQLMSAGSGLKHAETNPSQFEEVKGLQIWISTNQRESTPRYQQRSFSLQDFQDKLTPIFSPNTNTKSMQIRQDSYLQRAISSKKISYEPQLNNPKNGFYIFVITGEIVVGENILKSRDGLGISEIKTLKIEAKEGSDFLLFEIPMEGKF